jgi:hypothetical protein
MNRTFTIAAAVAAGLLALAQRAGAAEFTYTTSTDFAAGLATSVNDSVPDELRLDSTSTTEPFLYVAHTNDGILLKMDTRTGRQVARYHTTRTADCPSCPTAPTSWLPSRTAVDLAGDVWVANRSFNVYGSVTKIASSLGGCIDRNLNGVIDTSSDANGDGVVDVSDAAEFKGQNDECIVKSIPVGGQNAVLRALAIDGDGKLWVGGYLAQKIWRVDPDTGAKLRTIDVGSTTAYATTPYGFVVKGNVLYSAALGNPVLRIDFSSDPPVIQKKTCAGNYGITVDRDGVAWFGNLTLGGVLEADFGDANPCVSHRVATSTSTTGITVDPDGNFWVGARTINAVEKWSPSGTLLGTATFGSPYIYPYGVAVGADGAIWTVGFYGVGRVERGAPTGAPGAATRYSTAYRTTQAYNYTYSDMTGYLIRNITVQQGSWEVVQDGGFDGALWGTVSWNAEPEGSTPTGTLVLAEVRAADLPEDLPLRAWTPVSNGLPFSGAGVTGRFLAVRVTLRGRDEVSPVLSDVTIATAGSAPGATCSTDAECATGHCVDAVCCDSACSGQCEACAEPGTEGSCVAVLGLPRGGRTACASDGSLCGGVCDGAERLACAYPGPEVACRDASCAAGVETLAAVCSGAGDCPRTDRPCAPYVCDPEACLSSCSVHPDCAPGFVCEASACVPDVTPPVVIVDPLPPFAGSAAIVVTGRVEDAGGVETAWVTLDGAPAGSLALEPDGSFSLALTLSEGPHELLVQASDPAGNVGAGSAATTVDTVPPAVAFLQPLPGQAFGTSTVEARIEVIESSPLVLSVNGVLVALAAGATVAVPVDLPLEGMNALLALATDAAGNVGFASVDVLVDFGFPLVSLDVADGAAFGALAGSALPVTATVDDLGATGVVFAPAGGSFALARGGGVVQALVPLSEGRNFFEVTATDEVGHATTLARQVLYDTTAPAGEFASPAEGAFLRGTVETLVTAFDPGSGTGDGSGVASVTAWAEGGDPSPAAPGPAGWAWPLDTTAFPDGPRTLRALVLDGVGNTAEIARGVVLDNTPPTVAIDAPAAGAWVRGTIEIAASAWDDTAGVAAVEIRVAGALAGSCALAATCRVTFETGALPNGPFVVTALAIDRADNRSAPAQITLLADNTAPERFLVSPAEGEVVQGSVTVAVDVSDEGFAWVECWVDGASLGVSTDPRVSFTVSLLDRLDGPVEVRCEAADLAGNVGVETATAILRNWTLDLNPTTLALKTGDQSVVTLFVTGPNVSLLLPVEAHALTLVVEGGSPVPVLPHPAREGDRLVLKFDRPALVAAIRAGIASGRIDPSRPVPVRFLSGNRELGLATVRVSP